MTKLSYPERELALALAAVTDAAVYDAAVAAGMLADHITRPEVAAIWRVTAELRDAGETPRGAVMVERLRALKMEEPCRSLLARVTKVPVPSEAEARADAEKIVAAARAREADQALAEAVTEMRGAEHP